MYNYIVPPLYKGFPAYLSHVHVLYLVSFAPRKYKLHFPNMVSEPKISTARCNSCSRSYFLFDRAFSPNQLFSSLMAAAVLTSGHAAVLASGHRRPCIWPPQSAVLLLTAATVRLPLLSPRLATAAVCRPPLLPGRRHRRLIHRAASSQPASSSLVVRRTPRAIGIQID